MFPLRPSSPPTSSYQAMETPTQVENLSDGIGRGRSHSHALSTLLGANPRVSASPSVSLDWRPSSQVGLAPSSLTLGREPEKTERGGQWRHWRRRWSTGLVWSSAVLVFVACFVLAFVTSEAPKAPLVVGSGLSLISTVVVLSAFIKRRRRRRRPNELVAFVALSDFGLATLTLIHVVTLCAPDGECRSLAMAPCTAAVSLELFMVLTGIGWFGAAILHLFVSISNPFASYKRQLVLYHLVVWGVSLLASAMVPSLLFSEQMQIKYQLSETELCRMVVLILPLLPLDANESIASKRRRLTQWQDLNLACYGVVAAIVVMTIVAAQFSLVVGWWRSNSGTIIALKARRRLLKRMTVYVHAFTGLWLVLVAVFFIYRSNPRALEYIQVDGASVPTDEGRNVLHACFYFLVTGKGFVTGVVWLSVNKPCCILEVVCCGLHHCNIDEEDPSLGHSASQSASSSESYAQNVRTLRDDHASLLCAATVPLETIPVVHAPPMLSPSSTVSHFGPGNVGGGCIGRPLDHHSLPTLSSVFDPLFTARSNRLSSSCEASTVESCEASQHNETLQREIIYYTVCGITKALIRSAERAKLATATSSEPLDTNLATHDRDGGLVETTLFVGERDSLVNSSFISHVQSVPIQSSPRAYCEPRVPLSVVQRHSLDAFDEEVDRRTRTFTRPTSFPSASRVDPAANGHSRPLERSHRQGSARRSLLVHNATRPNKHESPGRFSLYPVSQVPFELFDHEIELESTRSSTDEPVEGKPTRSAVFAGLRRTATSAFSQGRGVFRGRSGSTDPETLNSSVPREFVLEDLKPKVFVDYAPRAFRAIRVAFHLSEEKYLASFRTTAKERVSAGSSGAFMFFTGDNSFLVKSLKEKECRALVEMAPAYARYLTANPHSRLIRFFGCHRVRLYGRNFYFAVMANVLHSESHTATIAEKYDIKGSWVDRRARRPQRGQRVTCAECNASYIFNHDEKVNTAGDGPDGRVSVDAHAFRPSPFHVHRPDLVLKDLDLERILHLPRSVAMHLHTQLVLDCEFLRDLGIMDYSLLIGIHKCHLRPSCSRSTNRSRGTSMEFETACHRLDESTSGVNLAPLGEKEVYFVGIIDILQQWDWEKQFEKAGKVLLGKNARGISAVAPAAYCHRFQARCTQILLGGLAPEALDHHGAEVDASAGSARVKSRPDSKNMKEMAVANLGTDVSNSRNVR